MCQDCTRENSTYTTQEREEGRIVLRFEDAGTGGANPLYCHAWVALSIPFHLLLCYGLDATVPPPTLIYIARILQFLRNPQPQQQQQHTHEMNPNHLDWSTITGPLSSHRAQLVLTAVASGVAVGTTLLAFQSARQNQKLRDIKSSIRSRDDSTAVCSRRNPFAQRTTEL